MGYINIVLNFLKSLWEKILSFFTSFFGSDGTAMKWINVAIAWVKANPYIAIAIAGGVVFIFLLLIIIGSVSAKKRKRKEAEAQKAKAAQLAAQKAAAEKAKQEKLAAEKAAAEKAEQERLEAERLAAEKAEQERLEAEILAAEKAEQERLEAERLAAEKAEQERLEAERLAAEKAEQERLEAERLAAEKAEQERLEAERLAAEKAEQERLEAERLAAEKAEQERLEAERLAAEKAKQEQEIAATATTATTETVSEPEISEATITSKPVSEKDKYSGKWTIIRMIAEEVSGETEEYYFFELRASNGEKLLTSEDYTTYQGALSGIKTYKANIAKGNFKIATTKKGDYIFKILNGKNTLLCLGENYSTRARCESALASTVRFAQKAIIEDTVVEQTVKIPVDNGEEIAPVDEAHKGQWIIYASPSIDGQQTFYFELYANNGERLLTSEDYTKYEGAINGIETHKNNIKKGNFRVSLTKHGDYIFKLMSGNGQLLCLGEHYKTKRLCQNAIESVKRFALNAPILTDPEIVHEQL